MSRLYLSKPCALFYRTFAHGAAGAVGARLSLRPLEDGGTMNWHHSGENALRERDRMSLHVIASEAKQSSLLRRTRKLDCFVASLLAMTVAAKAQLPYSFTAYGSGLPAKNACKFAITQSCIATCDSRVWPPVCGVSTTLGSAVSASGGCGSLANTSRPAPAMVLLVKASTSACWSITEPRAMLTTWPSSPSRLRMSALTMWSVSGPARTATMSTLHQSASVSRLSK